VQGIIPVHFLNHAPHVLWNRNVMADKNAANHKHSVLGLHLTAHIAHQCPSAGLDIPRCQRGGKSALQSSGGGGDHVVYRCRARFLNGGWVQAVVLGDCSVDAKGNRNRLGRKESGANRTGSALDFSFINIGGRWHRVLLRGQCRKTKAAELRSQAERLFRAGQVQNITKKQDMTTKDTKYHEGFSYQAFPWNTFVPFVVKGFANWPATGYSC